MCKSKASFCLQWLSQQLSQHSNTISSSCDTCPVTRSCRHLSSAKQDQTPEQHHLAPTIMSQTRSPQFVNVVDGVRLAQNITPNQTAEEQDTFEKITFSELHSYQRFIKIAELKPGETVLDLACGPGLTGESISGTTCVRAAWQRSCLARHLRRCE